MQKLRDIFSKVAGDYERYALFQAEIGDRLLLSLDGVLPHYILDIGMGTGRLTKEIAIKFPRALVFGCDFAEGMVRQSISKDSFYGLCADALFLPFRDDSFDLVVSNLTYQWVKDLRWAFSEVARILKDKGKFIFTCFGSNTLKELSMTISKFLKRLGNYNLTHSFYPLPDKAILSKQLNNLGFRKFDLNSYRLTKNYNDIFDLVGWLKKIGANRAGRSVFLGKNAWQEMNDFYKRNFSDNAKVFATFEVIKVEAEKIP